MRRRSRGAPSVEVLAGMRNAIARVTAGHREGMGLRVDFDRLSEPEQGRLVELFRQGEEGAGGFSWAKLPKRAARELEELIERGSDAAGAFEQARQAAEIRRLAERAHVAAVRRPFSRSEEAGLLSEMARCVEAGYLDAPAIGVLTTFVVAMVGGVPLGPHSRIDRVDGETVVVVDSTFCPFMDLEGQLSPRWRQTVDFLVRNDWLVIEKRGKSWTIGPGPRLRAAREGRPVKTVPARAA